MSASINDYFNKTGTPGSATFLTAPGHTVAGTSFTVDSTSLWPTDTAVVFGIDTTSLVNGVYTRDTGTYTVWRGVVASGTTITNCVLMYGVDQAYSAGSTTRVYILPTTSRENRLVDGLLIAHDQDGTLKAGAVDVTAVIADGVITKAKLATAEKTALDSGWSTQVGNTTVTAPTSITALGNRSYSIVHPASVATYKTPGFRNRYIRTITAPTQCADLESGSSQYFSNTTPAGMTFTDDFTCMAWVKLESYTRGGIIARRNADTEGWSMQVTATGQIQLEGFRIASNYASLQSYQSIPLNRWVHIAASLDMSGATGAMYIDGVLVPSLYAVTGTATVLIQGTTALVVGAEKSAGTNPFDGKIAQAAVFSSVLSASTIRSYMSQTLSGSESTLVSAYSLSNSLVDLVTGNANNLTAQGSALATNLDTPFTQTQVGITTGTENYSITTLISSTGLTETVQVAEGDTIPTSGGVSAMAYSTQKVPYGFPAQENRWAVESSFRGGTFTQSSPVNGTWYNLTTTSGTTGGMTITLPVGAQTIRYKSYIQPQGGAGGVSQFLTLSTGSNSESDTVTTTRNFTTTSSISIGDTLTNEFTYDITTSAIYYFNSKTDVVSVSSINISAASVPTNITATTTYL